MQPSDTDVTVQESSFPNLSLRPVDGNESPEDFAINQLGQSITTPSVLAKLVNNTHGIKFIGNDKNGTDARIVGVAIPGMGTTDDPGLINAAIQYILGEDKDGTD